jgi:hypothetical protein
MLENTPADSVPMSAASRLLRLGKRRGKVRLVRLEHLDGRTLARKHADKLLAGVTAALGGNLSVGTRAAVDHYVRAALIAEDASVRRMAGDPTVTIEDVTRTENSAYRALRRLERIGLDITSRPAEPAAPAASDPTWLQTFCAGIEAAAHSEREKVAAATQVLKLAGGDGDQG